MRYQKYIVLFLVVFAVFLIRPGIFGQLPNTSLVINIFFLFIFVISILVFKPVLYKSRLPFFLSVIPTFLLFILHALFEDVAILKNIITTIIFMFLPLFLLFIINKKKQVEILIKSFVWIVILLSASQLISQVLLYFNLVGQTSVMVPMGDEKAYSLSFVLPFSFIDYQSSTFNLFGESLPRSFGIFREAGIFQIFIIQAYFLLDYLKNRSRILKPILIVTLLLTFSTTGIIILLICYIYKAIFLVKKSIKIKDVIVLSLMFITISLAGYVFIYSESYSFTLASKLSGTSDTGVSGLSRLYAVQQSVLALKENLFLGVGMYSEVATLQLSKVNLLSLSGQIGIVGLFIFILPFVYVGKKSFGKKSFLVLIPLILTYLFSQPFFDKPLTYFLLGFIYLLSVYEKK